MLMHSEMVCLHTRLGGLAWLLFMDTRPHGVAPATMLGHRSAQAGTRHACAVMRGCRQGGGRQGRLVSRRVGGQCTYLARGTSTDSCWRMVCSRAESSEARVSALPVQLRRA